LPLQSISPDPNDEYFADGLTEELITVLSQVKGLRIIARTSVSRYKGTDRGVKEIGNELQVGSVLEGSVRKSANKVRVTAKLIDVASEEHVWADKYDRDLDDIFLIQSDIAKHVSDGLSITLGPAEENRIDKKETASTVAHLAYLKGRTLLHKRVEKGIREAQEQFELAIKSDPHYARAYAGLADVYIILGVHLFAPLSQCREKSRTFVKKALELDPNLAEAHVSLGWTLTEDYRFADAEKEYEQAIALNPSYALAHHWYSILLGELGRGDEGLREALLAEELDPLSPVISQTAFMWNLRLGVEGEVTKRVERFREMGLDPFALGGLIMYHLWKFEYAQALDYCAKLQQRSLDFPASSPEPYIAYIYAATGRRKEAVEILSKLESSASRVGSVPFFEIALIYAGLNDLDGCFKCLDRAFENHDRFFIVFRYFPFLENVRKNKRFNDLLKRANLPPIN
jgi:adenylate cyclase